MEIVTAKKNAIINVLGWLLPAIIFLTLTPIMVNYLGIEGFGVVVIIQILTGYMTILNFGFSEAIIKQVAETIDRDHDQAIRIMWVGLCFFLIAGSSGALLIYFSAHWLSYTLLNIPTNLQYDTFISLRIGAIVFFLQMIAEFYRGTAIGCNKFIIPSVSKIIRVSISSIFIVIVLMHGGGLVEVMTATLLGLVLGLLVNAVWMQRSIPMHLILHGYSGIALKILDFGKHIFFSRIANMISGKLSQFILGTLSSVANVALYEAPLRAVTAATVILNQSMQVFLPGFSAMDKVKDINRIKGIYFTVLSIQLFFIVPIFLTLALEGSTLLSLWINDDFAQGAGKIIITIVIAYFISSLTALPSQIALSFNFPQLISKYSAIRMIVSLVSVYPLINYFGLVGAALVLLISEIVGIPFLYEVTRKAFGVNFFIRLRPNLIKHGLMSISIYIIYDSVYRNSDWYHPISILGIPIIYMLFALVLGVTSASENKKMVRLITKWR